MSRVLHHACCASIALIMGLAGLAIRPAQAIPAFADQTGQACTACHIGGFGPQLTPFGRKFKLEGYTYRSSDKFAAPVSAMALASYLHTQKDQSDVPAPHYAVNDNATIDQISAFVAGGVGKHFGGFLQTTYDGVGRVFSWDNLDLRGMTHTNLADGNLVVGMSVNNSPGVQDLWNTLPAWGFPSSSSDLTPAPATGTVLDGALAQGVLGTSVYADWNSEIYAEAGVYWTPDRGFLKAMGVSVADTGIISGGAPYFRATYQKDYGTQNFEVGAFGFFPNIYPGGDKSAATTDDYSDYGLDASYQYMGSGKNVYSANARFTREDQHLAASQALGNAAKLNDTLDDARFDVSYYWHNYLGGTVSAFNTWGSSDAGLYADNRTLRPDSTGFEFEVDATPFANKATSLGAHLNLRVGLQYLLYTRFNGASTNFDALGRSASDNNTIRMFLWFAG